MQCSQQVIRAHSIQNGQAIELLAEDDHVIAIQPHYSATAPELQFRPIGRSEASTFPGFCNQHETEIFRPLDIKPLDTTDKEQLFLLAYRSISRELHAIMDGASKV